MFNVGANSLMSTTCLISLKDPSIVWENPRFARILLEQESAENFEK
jgi:hypothetical protein